MPAVGQSSGPSQANGALNPGWQADAQDNAPNVTQHKGAAPLHTAVAQPTPVSPVPLRSRRPASNCRPPSRLKPPSNPGSTKEELLPALDVPPPTLLDPGAPLEPAADVPAVLVAEPLLEPAALALLAPELPAALDPPATDEPDASDEPGASDEPCADDEPGADDVPEPALEEARDVAGEDVEPAALEPRLTAPEEPPPDEPLWVPASPSSGTGVGEGHAVTHAAARVANAIPRQLRIIASIAVCTAHAG